VKLRSLIKEDLTISKGRVRTKGTYVKRAEGAARDPLKTDGGKEKAGKISREKK